MATGAGLDAAVVDELVDALDAAVVAALVGAGMFAGGDASANSA